MSWMLSSPFTGEVAVCLRFIWRSNLRLVDLGFGGAVAQLDALLRGIARCRLFDDRPKQRPIGRDPVADHLPLRPVPLLESHAAFAFMVFASDVDRMEKVLGAECCN